MEPPGPEYVSLLSGWRTTLDLRGGQEGRAGWFSCHGLSGRQDQNRGGSMAKIKVIHDSIAHILTVWTGDPTKGAMCLSLIHISEPTRQAEISYAVFCLKK